MTVIQLCNVDYLVRGLPILQNIDLSIAQNEFIGIFGPNGGGKTTFLRLIMGFIQPTKGSIRLFNQAPELMRHFIGYVPQTHRVDFDFPITVEELVGMGLLRGTHSHSFSASDRAQCSFWLERLGLIDHRHKSYGSLSGGLAQRTLLARALIADPKILILDEPTAHIDAQSLSIFLDVLDQLRTKKTILLVTHDLKMLDKRASRFFCLRNRLSLFMPHEICEHFHLGIYHAPLSLKVRS